MTAARATSSTGASGASRWCFELSCRVEISADCFGQFNAGILHQGLSSARDFVSLSEFLVFGWSGIAPL